MPEYGVPWTSSSVSISSAGMTPRIVRSIAAIRFSDSSMRVPGGSRQCSLISPASTDGKKSRPTSWNRASGSDDERRERADHEAAMLETHASPRP